MPLTWQKYQGDLGQIVSYILEYRKKTPSDQESIEIIKDASIVTNSKEVTGLEAATSYQVRVSINTTDFGCSPPSEWMNFKTKDASTEKKSATDNQLSEIVSNLANIKK